MLTRVFVVIALLACNSNAASLQSSSSSLDPLDLEVVTLDSQGNATNDRLLQLRSVAHVTD